MRRLLVVLVVFLMCLEAQGQEVVWEKRIGWSRTDELTDVIATPGGSFIACGTSYHFGIDDIGATRHDAICLISLLPNGDTA